MILFNNPKNYYLENKKEIISTTKNFFESGFYVKSNSLKKFEENFANYVGSKFCIGVGNGTDALYLSLKCLGIKSGDEIIIPSHTATGTGTAILMCNAKPIFVDVDDTLNIDVNNIEKFITKKTKVIIPVHLYGQSCEMLKLNKIANKYKIKVIEDCSQSFGTRLNNKHTGTFGNFGCFSFYPTKNLGCFGDGGAIITNSKSKAKLLYSMREYGWNSDRNAINFGINSRLDELQSYYLNFKLKNFDNNLNRKIKIANRYFDKIKNPKIKFLQNVPNSKHSYHLFVVRVKNRETLIKKFIQNGIYPGIHYKLPLHKQSQFIKYYKKNHLINTNQIVKEILSIPIYPELKIYEQDKVIRIINSF